MTVSRLPRLTVGDEVSLGGSAFTDTALAGGTAALTSVTGEVSAVPLTTLLTDPTLSAVTPTRRRAPLPDRGLLEGFPPEVVARAEWWERHVIEVVTGTPPAPASTRRRAEYDPLRRSLRQRELDKVAELTAGGETVSLATLCRMRRRYQREGLLGLVDGRLTRSLENRVDPRLTAAIEKAVADETDRSTGTVTRLRRRVEQVLRSEHGIDPAGVLPPRSTFYRLTGLRPSPTSGVVARRRLGSGRGHTGLVSRQ